MNKQFINLHVHQHIGSVGDSVAAPKDVVERCLEVGQPGIALTDHGMMCGLIEHYSTCVKAGLKPILGVEAYYAEDISDKDCPTYHVVLLAKNLEGYRSIMHATSRAYTEGFFKKTRRKSYIGRMNWDMISELHDVVVLSGCIQGVVAGPFRSYGDTPEVREIAQRFHTKFGDDFYLELQWHKKDSYLFEACNEYLIKLGEELGIQTVLTNDVHYSRPEDWKLHMAWTATSIAMPIDEEKYFYDDTYYIKSAEEMLEIAPNQECFDNTWEIFKKIDFIDLNIGVGYVPKFQGQTVEESNKLLIELTEAGLKEMGVLDKDEYVDRANEELEFIVNNDLSAYFLLIWDAMKATREMGVSFGVGRGSSGGSLVVRALGITQVDPIEYDLKFSRFLNSGRCYTIKEWVVEDENGMRSFVYEGLQYHIMNEDGSWVIVNGEDLVKGL